MMRRRPLGTAQRLTVTGGLVAAYGWWLFSFDSPWTRAARSVDRRLPETVAGFPEENPAAALTGSSFPGADYLWFQAFDLVFAALAAIFAMRAIGAGARRLAVPAMDARLLMATPALYFAFEFIENMLLAGFAAGIAAPSGALALIQHAATTGKFAGGLVSALFAMIGYATIGATTVNKFAERWT